MAKKAKSKKSKKPAARPVTKKKAAPKKIAKPVKTKAKAAAKKTVAKKKTVSKTSSTGPKPHAFVTPLEDRVLIYRQPAATTTPGGLYLPEPESEQPSQGRVLAVGQGKRTKKGVLRRLELQVGDQVLIGPVHGPTLVHQGVEYLLVREHDVLGVIVN